MSIEDQLSKLAGGFPDGISEGVALGTGLADGFDLYPSPLGEVVVTFNIEGVSSLDLATKGYEGRFAERHGRSLFRAEPPTAWGRHIPKAIEAGTPGNLPVDLRSRTPFEAKVLRIAATIPEVKCGPMAGWPRKPASRTRGRWDRPWLATRSPDHPLPSGGPIRRVHRRVLVGRPT